MLKNVWFYYLEPEAESKAPEKEPGTFLPPITLKLSFSRRIKLEVLPNFWQSRYL